MPSSAQPGQRHRAVRLVGAVQVADIRTATFDGTPHVVVPVIALVEGVLHAVNSPHPELVRYEVFAEAPRQWDNRPVVGDHPTLNGNHVSANSQQVLETLVFGRLFNAEARDRRLFVEAWLDPARARRVGRDAERVIERVQAGEVVEVSVGAWVTTREAQGEWEGQEYAAEWVTIASDHLAMLPEGSRGACSVDAGCGGPRTARTHVLTAAGAHVATEAEVRAAMSAGQPAAGPKGDGMNVMGKLGELFSFRTAQTGPDDWSDDERRTVLGEGLKRLEREFVSVVSVTGVRDGDVVYLVDPDPGGPMPLKAFKRTYDIDDDGRPRYSEERVPMRMRNEWVPLLAKKNTAAEPGAEQQQPKNPVAATVGCGCRDADGKGTEGAAGGAGGDAVHRNAERIKALIENGKTPWSADDVKYLEGLTDERLAAFEEAAKPAGTEDDADEDPAAEPAAEVPPAAQPAAAPATPPQAAAPAAAPVQAAAAEPKPLSEAEFMRQAPQSIRDIVTSYKAQQAQRKQVLLAGLKASGQTAYGDDELKAMDVAQLEKLATLAGVGRDAVDYSGQGGPGVVPREVAPLRAWDKALGKKESAA